MIAECRTYATQAAARGAITVATATWTPPVYVNVGPGPHVDHAKIGPPKLSEPLRLANGRWAVIANHPTFRGETIDSAVDLPTTVLEALPVDDAVGVVP